MDLIMPVSEVRNKLPSLIKTLSGVQKHLIITKNGFPEAVMMSPEEFETLEIMADKELLMSISKAKTNINNKELYSMDEVFDV